MNEGVYMLNRKKQVVAFLLTIALLAGNTGTVTAWQDEAIRTSTEAGQAASGNLGYTLEQFCVDLHLWNNDEKDIQVADEIINGQLYLDTTITERFSYPVSYYINTQNGDHEYWSFPAVQVN